MDIVTGALPSLIPKLADLVAGEYNLRKGVKGEIMALQAQLESFMGALQDISNAPADELDEPTLDWSREVRELSYDMESSVDRFMVRCNPDKQARHHGFKDGIKNNVDLLIQPIIRHKFAAEIRNMKSCFHELYDRGRHRYKVEDNRNQHVTVDPRLQTLYEDQERLVAVRIDSAKDELIKIMLEGNESSMQQRNIVSIVGFGGLGKTTLAKAVYGELQEKFDCSAFVSASQTPDMHMIFKSLLYQFDEDNRKTMDLDLTGKLREFLQQKRYLVVIDDIWGIPVWEGIRGVLPHNDYGYRIIITTRSVEVAEQAGGAYEMKPLSLSDSRRLFYNRIFGPEYKNVCPEDLLEISEKILEICNGLPLAIVAIASLLANKHPTKMTWYKVYNSIAGGGSVNFVSDMTNILSLSYSDMPSSLRNCLLYLSMFPREYEIDKSRLIWMWIAEGFIQGRNMFETGERYFNELIDRSMIQPVYHYGMIDYCRVHDIIFDFIHRLSHEENFVTILDDEYHTFLSKKTRRLSLQHGKEDNSTTQTTRSIMGQIRSVIVFPSAVDRMPSLGNLRDLCVLDLNDCDLSQGCSLKYLGSLFHLRYLGLSNTHIAQIPEVGNLHFLQTLNITCNEIANLPSSIVHLKHLMCLQIDRDTRVPNGIANLTSLEELSQISIYNSADIEALCCLTELRVLDIYCYTECMESLEKSLVDYLCNLPNVQNLSVWVDSGECKLDDWVLPQHLCRLNLHGCWFSTLPVLVSPLFLMNLSFISIAVIELQKKDLESLGSLPALCYLNLKVDHENLGVLRRFIIDAGLFQRLLSCVLWGFRGPVIYTQDSMPSLTSLRFTLHVQDMGEIPGSSAGGYNLGIENLLSLQDVTVLLRCGGVRNQELQEVKAALRHATKIHPNNPTIDFIGYEDQDEKIDWT